MEFCKGEVSWKLLGVRVLGLCSGEVLYDRLYVGPEFSDTNVLAAVDLCGKNFVGTDICGLDGL